MSFLLRWLPSHEGVGQPVLWVTLAVAGLVIAFELAGAPAVVQRAAATLLAKLHIIIDHLIRICVSKQDRQRKCDQKHCSLRLQMSTITICDGFGE